MSKIVLGIGTSHSPLLVIDPSDWLERGKDDRKRKEFCLTDGRTISYDALAAEVHEQHAACATLEIFETQARTAHAALDHLAEALDDVRPDVLVIIGDDQEELFSRAHLPALAIYTGACVVMHPKNEVSPDLPQWYRKANIGYSMDQAHLHRGAPELASHLVESLITDGVDVSVATAVEDPRKAGFGHAFGFIIERLCKGITIPIVPVMLNTYYPPNVPTPARCYDVGKALAKAIHTAPGSLRVVVVASGGLTHFHTDEAFDTTVLKAMHEHDAVALKSLPVKALRSGNSEILNWVMAAGALEELAVDFEQYIPVRRTPAGTGVGLGFVIWRPQQTGSETFSGELK
jgi:hypothetical protein